MGFWKKETSTHFVRDASGRVIDTRISGDIPREKIPVSGWREETYAEMKSSERMMREHEREQKKKVLAKSKRRREFLEGFLGASSPKKRVVYVRVPVKRKGSKKKKKRVTYQKVPSRKISSPFDFDLFDNYGFL